MRAKAFLRAVTADRAHLLERFLALMDVHGVRFCIIGGQAVNAYVEPLVSLDLDVVVATEQLPAVEALLDDAFVVERFPQSLNITVPESDVRIQLQTDPRYATFVDRSRVLDVLGHSMPVAALEDVLQGKVWAALDPAHRPSKRQKGLTDIARILEANPTFRSRVPQALLDRLL